MIWILGASTGVLLRSADPPRRINTPIKAQIGFVLSGSNYDRSQSGQMSIFNPVKSLEHAAADARPHGVCVINTLDSQRKGPGFDSRLIQTDVQANAQINRQKLRQSSC